jgi:hypothetical protein
MAEERMQLKYEVKKHGLKGRQYRSAEDEDGSKATALQTRTAVLTGKIQEFERIGNLMEGRCTCSSSRARASKRKHEENDQEEDGEDEADEPAAKRHKALAAAAARKIHNPKTPCP